MGCRLRLPALKCDRHPDQTISLSPPPDEGPKPVTPVLPGLEVRPADLLGPIDAD